MDVMIGSYCGQVNPAVVGNRAMPWLADIAQHIQGDKGTVLAAGRNRNILVPMPLDDGNTLDVVVKAFGRSGAFQAWRARRVGSKARRTWRASMHLAAAGAGTPMPVAFMERTTAGMPPEQYVITVFQDHVTSFAHALDDLYRREPDCETLMSLLNTVAVGIRKMHECGFMHNDLGNQNILLRRTGAMSWGDVQVIDLNRGRIRADGLTDRDRGRDLSRIALPSDFMRIFIEMYYGGTQVPPPEVLRWESHYRRRFAWHTRTRRWRHPLREARRHPAPGDPPTYPAPKDLWIWDERSGQPIITMQSRERSTHYPVSRNVRILISSLKALPRTWRDYRRFQQRAFKEPIQMAGRIGVAVEFQPTGMEQQLALLERLGALPVLVRFYHHRGQETSESTAALVETLRRRGHPVSIAIIQDRQAVLDSVSWDVFVTRILDRIGTRVDLVEAGHAINRVKWGVWDFAEYSRLMAPFAAWQKKHPETCIGGPAMIDFEYAYIPAALDSLPDGLRFNALTHHLYVDRRGAPETAQGAFAALEKFALARALAERTGGRFIVSEFNWPLRGTGVYSPVGAPYESPGERHNDPSVGEQEAAAYLLRYILIAICSGLVERVFWWRLAALGYGLVDDNDHCRERPAFKVLEVLLSRLEKSTFTGRTESTCASGGKAIWYRFESASGTNWWMGYTGGDPARAPRPGNEGRAYDAFGLPMEIESEIPLGMLPVYVVSEEKGEQT
ncbi:MAG TPA: hypothetical protein DCS43_11540 [Verrucomicrobia bacterium]|nr:hypothetical protein [Verrucomicrobiota bacterium]